MPSERPVTPARNHHTPPRAAAAAAAATTTASPQGWPEPAPESEPPPGRASLPAGGDLSGARGALCPEFAVPTGISLCDAGCFLS
jgi:hypothetical protein